MRYCGERSPHPKFPDISLNEKYQRERHKNYEKRKTVLYDIYDIRFAWLFMSFFGFGEKKPKRTIEKKTT